MKIRELIELYESNMIRCSNCNTLKELGVRLATTNNLGFGCCVPYGFIPQNWGTDDAPQWILDLRR